ncbi:MAG: enoyl-CoA hydratase [Rickettsiales bacterium]|nr:MAG: enoyl-CoA hydratase [Rickettsiales bacterium]
MQGIKKVCVIGSGVMGSGIAASVANSKTEVILLDIADENPTEDKNSNDASSIARAAVERMFSAKPQPLLHPDFAKYITPGNLRDDLELIKECDLIIEVIPEKLPLKHKLYDSILPYLKESAILASNTSTLPARELKKNLPENVQDRFVITHFFNPPRYMELLEFVSDDNTSADAIKRISEFVTVKLGKTIVACNDTPGFIANRVGCFLLEMVVRKAIERKLDPVKIDQIFNKLLGFPKTGIFGLYDLIGHDVMGLISESLKSSLPKGDKYHDISKGSPVLRKMATKGLLGRKSGAGFYKLTKNNGKRTKEVIDFTRMKYSVVSTKTIPKTIAELLEGNNKYSKFFTEILADFFSYAISLVGVVASDSGDIDKAMRLGYSLKYGIFELLEERIPSGMDWLRKASKNDALHYEPSSALRIDAWYDIAKNVTSNDSAMLLDYKNQHIFVITSKMNSLNHDVFNLLIDSVARSEDTGKNLYICQSDAPNFSAGADLKFFYDNIEESNFKAIEDFVELGQKAMMALKYSKASIISCAHGVALGGGCELLLHSDFVVAHQNLSAGLVELGVGLVPGWGGVKEMFLRSGGDEQKLLQNLSNILLQSKSRSAEYFAQEYGVDSLINMNKSLILEEALAIKVPKKPKLNLVNLPPISLAASIDSTNFDELQLSVMDFFQQIIDLKIIDEFSLLELEKEKFLRLAAKPLCLKRLNRFV